MPLSFEQELQASLPEHTYGVEYCLAVDAWLTQHQEARVECVNIVRSMLLKMEEYSASDLDLGAAGCNNQIWLRVYGIKKPYPVFGTFSFLATTSMILCWLSTLQKKYLYNRKDVDFSSSLEDTDGLHRYRGSVYYDQNFPAATFRRINLKIFPIETLGFAKPIIERMDLRFEKTGLTIVTGITGSGKSTTLDSIVDMNNRISQGHIIIIALPIEFIHTSRQCIVRHREVTVDVESFEAGAVESLRHNPDIVVVGEMRDPTTIATVLEITDSGHKVFTTLHTSSAIDSVHRIVAEFPNDEQERIRNRLSEVLSVIVSQKLVPTLDNKLVMAKEVLSVDSSVQAAIRNKNVGEVYQMMIEGKKYGMITLEQDLHDLYRRGVISNKTALNYANNKKRILQLLSSI